MTTNHYDVIVVGARCAGSPTAMLLARQGYRVLLVDRATFPSDTISTHVIQPTGIAALKRWGLLDQLLSTGCPPVGTYAFDFGPFTIAGSPGTDDSPVAYAPRRTVLDKLLIDAAAAAGAEVRQGFTVQEVLTDDSRVTGVRGRGEGGHVVSEHARFVIGADGLHSAVAAAVSGAGRRRRLQQGPHHRAGYL
jgi:2-polyprenyl-6-methoxyphenol hydroxylase-like FAD-dependent oxidoreductase